MGKTVQKTNNVRNALIIMAFAGMLLFAVLVQQGYILGNKATSTSSNNLTAYSTVVVAYTDGSTMTYTLSGFQPFSIYDPNQGLIVSSVQFNLFMAVVFYPATPAPSYTLTYAYTPTIVKALGIIPYFTTGATVYQNTTNNLSLAGSSIASTYSYKILSYNISATALQALYSGWQTGSVCNYALSLVSPSLGDTTMTIVLTFPDGTAGTASTIVPRAYWIFQYQSPYSIISVAATWSGATA